MSRKETITWIDIKESPKYQVSNTGLVRNKNTGRVLRQEMTYRGYKRVSLDGKHNYVHRLVAGTFFDGDHEGLDAVHLDGNKTNNHVSNLKWMTRKENISHAIELGLKVGRKLKNA